MDKELPYLEKLGVTAIYFNPIFDGGSNHGYDTQDYLKVDPYFGTQKDFDDLIKHAKSHGIRVILDGVYNHMSSDSPLFDRYHHYTSVGACELATSPYRSWFTFHDVAAGTGTCVSSTGQADSATYDGWFGFDSIPVLTKSQPAVQEYFLTSKDSVAKHWIKEGASGWRLDVAGDASFPNGYWESFRAVVKKADPQALTISETWQKDSHPPADAPRRPARYDDELPPARCRARAARSRELRSEGLRRQRPPDQRVGVREPARVDPRGLSGRGLLLADEPARQPRHAAAPVDAHRGPRDDRRTRGDAVQPWRPGSCASSSRR